jgi:hypothetical protein
MPSEESTKERESTLTVENADSPRVYRPEIDVSSVDERKLMRRIDWHVVPWLAVLYLLNFLDRGNIGNARVRRRFSISYRCRSITDLFITVIQDAR